MLDFVKASTNTGHLIEIWGWRKAEFSKPRFAGRIWVNRRGGREKTYKKGPEAKDSIPYSENYKQLGMAQVQSVIRS